MRKVLSALIFALMIGAPTVASAGDGWRDRDYREWRDHRDWRDDRRDWRRDRWDRRDWRDRRWSDSRRDRWERRHWRDRHRRYASRRYVCRTEWYYGYAKRVCYRRY
jgi:hypothetical protein